MMPILPTQQEDYDPKWLDENYLSKRWIKGKYKCLKETPKCSMYPWGSRKAGRIKCIPCKHLEVTHPDGSVTSFSDSKRTVKA